jgi:anaerobic magnesium-protoporphyrin IX monomethyl ester cyclase
MRVMIINSPIDTVLSQGHVTPVTAYLFYNSAPLGILWIAAVLEQRGETVAVLDAAAEKLDVAETVRRVQAFKPDIIGIGSTTVVFETACLLGKAIKAAMPDKPLLLGGWHVTVAPDHAMSFDCFDVGTIDEAEYTVADLVDHYKGLKPLSEIAGIVYRENGKLVTTPPRKKLQSLDSLPFPARHLLPPDLYQPVPIDEHGTPKFAMMTSRGCPHSCAFCQKSRSGYRSHSPERIVDEMEHLVREYGAKDIAFVDSLFCASYKRVERVCDEIIRRGVNVSWTCSSRVEVVDKPLLQKMKDAGCWRTRFGIESGSDRVLDFIAKGINKEKIRAAVTAAHEVGLRPKAFFILGHMPDSKESIEETIAFAKTLPLHDVTVQINTLLPRTPQMEIWQREGEKWGRLINESTTEKSFWEPTFVPWGLESADLVKYHRQFYREFYFRPVTIQRHLDNMKSWRDIYKYAQAANLFGFLFFDTKLPSISSIRKRFGAGAAEMAVNR